MKRPRKPDTPVWLPTPLTPVSRPQPTPARQSSRSALRRAAFLSALCFAAPAIADDPAFFTKQVLPILEQRCYECHSHGGKIKGGLALDSLAGWSAGGHSGDVIVPGDPAKSLLIEAIDYGNPDYQMPPKGKLPEAEIEVLREWVQRGAPDPRAGGVAAAREGIDLDAGRQFWAFRPIARPTPPTVERTDWPARPSDRFLLATLEANQLAPAPDAEPARLIRRLSYDLTGLPPAPEEIERFVAAMAVDPQRAIEAAADRLLASPHFGEKWGRHWLDLARYADSNGSSFNPPFPQAWRYRNWVIAAHNADLPFDRFFAMQLAGDLLPYATQQERDDNLIATGYLVLGSKVLGEFDKEQLLMDVVDEQVDTVGKSMLALTLGCARCHDHKFDPVPQKDYYAIAGIFTSTVTLQDRYGGPKEDESDWSRRGLGPGNDERLQAFLAQHRYDWIRSNSRVYGNRKRIPELEQKLAALGADPAHAEEREKLERDLAKARETLASASAKLAELETQLPPYAEAVAEAPQPADTPLRVRGSPGAKAHLVPRGFLQIAAFPGQPEVNPAQSGRLELAQWIGSPQNPLTARVLANRVWQRLFVEGIVRSVDNFGPRGDLPTHPELLDYLAQRLIAGGWRIKPLIRELVTSRAYRMSTRYSAEAAARDPENRLLWRQHPRRLEPEEIRDTLLLVAGELDLHPATTLLPDLPMKSLEGGEAPLLAVQDARRTVYQPIIRTMEPDILQVFDFAPTAMTTGQRAQTTVAPQALYFLNAPAVLDAAEKLATRVAPARAGLQLGPVVRAAFQIAIGRVPSGQEQQLLEAYLRAQFEGPPGPTLHDLAKLCHAILGSTQFQFLD